MSIEIKNEGGMPCIFVRGAFDERIQLPEDLNCDTVILDLDELTLFNSMGVRIWLKWSKGKKGFKHIRLRNCRSHFMRQMAVLAGALPEHVHVESFYAPYFSPATGSEAEIKFSYGREYDDKELHMPTPTLDGQPLELDVDDNYFNFLKGVRKS